MYIFETSLSPLLSPNISAFITFRIQACYNIDLLLCLIQYLKRKQKNSQNKGKPSETFHFLVFNQIYVIWSISLVASSILWQIIAGSSLDCSSR